MKKTTGKFKVRYIFFTLGIIALIVIGIVMRETFVGKFIFFALDIIVGVVIGIVMFKAFKGKIKGRHIFITLGIIIALFVISNLMRLTFAGQVKNMQKTFEADMESKVNSIVDERLAEFYSNQSSYTPSDNFTDVSWPEDSMPSVPENTSNPSAENIVTIANSKASNSTNWNSMALTLYDSYDDAFNSATVLESGRYVIITVKSNSKVENIIATASMFNPTEDDFEVYPEFSFKSSTNSNGEYRVNFKIPDNQYISDYNDGSINFVAVFEIVTNEGSKFVSCAY